MDAIKLVSSGVETGVLVYEQEKTDGTAVCPVDAPVDDFLLDDQVLFLSAISSDLIWMLTETGRPRSIKGLSQYISAAATTGGLNNCTAHGLHKARATRLANNGWSPHKIGVWTGHESLSEIALYTRSVNLRGLISRTEQDQNLGNRVGIFRKPIKQRRRINSLLFGWCT